MKNGDPAEKFLNFPAQDLRMLECNARGLLFDLDNDRVCCITSFLVVSYEPDNLLFVLLPSY